MILKKLLCLWSARTVNRAAALLWKEWLVYADQKFYVLASLAFQVVLVFSLFGLNRFWSGGAAGSFNYSFLVMMVILIFSAVSGYLPGRLLQEIENKNLTACLLTPATFFEWVLAAGFFGWLINSLYLVFFLGAGCILYRLNWAAGIFLALSLLPVFLMVFALGLVLAALTLVFRRGYVFYGFLEMAFLLFLAAVLPGGGLTSWLAVLKISPHYLVFQLLNFCLTKNYLLALKYQLFLVVSAGFFGAAGIVFLKSGFNLARRQGVF